MPDAVGRPQHQPVVAEGAVGHPEARLPVVLVVIGRVPRFEMEPQLPGPVAAGHDDLSVQRRFQHQRVEERHIVMNGVEEGGIAVGEPHREGDVGAQFPAVVQVETPGALSQVGPVGADPARRGIGDPQEETGESITRELARKPKLPAAGAPGFHVVVLVEVQAPPQGEGVRPAHVGIAGAEGIAVLVEALGRRARKTTAGTGSDPGIAEDLHLGIPLVHRVDHPDPGDPDRIEQPFLEGLVRGLQAGEAFEPHLQAEHLVRAEGVAQVDRDILLPLVDLVAEGGEGGDQPPHAVADFVGAEDLGLRAPFVIDPGGDGVAVFHGGLVVDVVAHRVVPVGIGKEP